MFKANQVPEAVVPEPENPEFYGEYEYYVQRIRDIVKLIEGEWSVKLSGNDGDWILKTLEEHPQEPDSQILEWYVEEFEIPIHYSLNPSDMSDYASDTDFRN